MLCADYERMQGGHEGATASQRDPSQFQVALPGQMTEAASQTIRQDMTISTLDFNSKEGQIIPVDDDATYKVIAPYLHTAEEAQLREVIWKEQNAEYLRELRQRKKRLAEQQKRKEKKKRQGVMSHASQVSQSGMTPGGESIGQGSGDHQSSELDGNLVFSDRDDNLRGALSNPRETLNYGAQLSGTAQNTPHKEQEFVKAANKRTPKAITSGLGKREAPDDIADKEGARKKTRKEAQKPQDKGLLLQDLFDEDD